MIADHQILDGDTIRDKTPEEMGQKPEEKKPVTEPEKEEEEENQPEAKKEDPKKPAEKEEEEEEEEEEEKPKEGETDDDGKKKEGEEGKKSDDGDQPVAVDEFLKEKYAEAYGIENEKQLDEVLAVAAELEKENDELVAKIEALEKDGTKIKFESEQEEKAFNFIKNFPMDKLGEGMQTFVRVGTMDLKSAEPKIILEEKFILENPELTREEAIKKFNRDYNRKYTVKQEDYIDDDAAYKEEVEMRNIDLKADVARAREFLAKKQTEFKSKPKETEAKEAKVSEVVTASIKEYISEVEDYMKEFDTLTFSIDDKTDPFKYKFSKTQKDQLREALKGWVGNSTYYDAKGKLIGSKGMDEDVQNFAYHLFGNDMMEKALKHGLTKGEIKRVDEISKSKPDRTSKNSNGKMAPLTEVGQWEVLANLANGKTKG